MEQKKDLISLPLEEFSAVGMFWQVFKSAEGYTYYFDPATLHSQWQDPRVHGLQPYTNGEGSSGSATNNIPGSANQHSNDVILLPTDFSEVPINGKKEKNILLDALAVSSNELRVDDNKNNSSELLDRETNNINSAASEYSC